MLLSSQDKKKIYIYIQDFAKEIKRAREREREREDKEKLQRHIEYSYEKNGSLWYDNKSKVCNTRVLHSLHSRTG